MSHFWTVESEFLIKRKVIFVWVIKNTRLKLISILSLYFWKLTWLHIFIHNFHKMFHKMTKDFWRQKKLSKETFQLNNHNHCIMTEIICSIFKLKPLKSWHEFCQSHFIVHYIFSFAFASKLWSSSSVYFSSLSLLQPVRLFFDRDQIKTRKE